MNASRIARRPLLFGGLVGLGIAAIGLLTYEAPRIFEPRYPRTPYDDLLGRLSSRENAERLGSAVLAGERAFDAQHAAHELRTHLKSLPLAAAVDADVHDAHLAEVHGWVLPSTLAKLCALAAVASLPGKPGAQAVHSAPVQTSGI